VGAPLQIGRYVLHDEIASGGMASVHYGRLVGTGGFAKTVAIKRLHRQLARTESFRNMILEEARLAARVRHPNVVPPLDVLAEGGELLLVMEYVHGESLSRLLRAARAATEKVPLAVGAAIIANVLAGLHAAHEAKDESGKRLDIVHRDVSPQNVIVGVDGIARVIDFGIAKAVTSEANTVAGTIKGKVPYLAPEQLEGDRATRRTDIYAASVVFWEVLAGKRLFDGADDAVVLSQIMTMEVPPPSKYNPSVPGSVDDVVLKGLARKPSDRYATAREMAMALEGAVHLATATVVGAWAERLAEATLAARAERIREVEAAPPPSEEIELAEPETSHGTVRMAPPPSKEASVASPPSRKPSVPPPPSKKPSLPPPPPSKKPSTPPPGLAPHGAPSVPLPPPPPMRRSSPELGHAIAAAPHAVPRSTAPAAVEVRTIIYEPPPMPEPEFVAGVRPLSQSAPPGATPPAPFASPGGAPSPPAAGVLRKPEVLIKNVEWLPDRPAAAPAKGSRLKAFFGYLAALLLLALVVAWMFAPAIVRAWLVTSAKERGVVLTIERVDVSRKLVHLVDVKAESAEMPGVAVRVGTLDIGLRWLAPDKVTLDDAELTLEGAYPDVGARLDRWRAAHARQIDESLAGVRQVEVTSGRIDWRDVAGPSTSALVENVTLSVTKNAQRALGNDYKFSAPLFAMKLGASPAGPWQIDVDRQGVISRAVVKLDPSGMFPASVTRTVSDDGSASMQFAIPPTRLRDLRVPPVILSGLATDRTRFEARGELQIAAAAKAAREVSGRLTVIAGNLAVFPGGAPVDLALDLPLAGDVSKPVPAAATLSLSPADPPAGPRAAAVTTSMTGTVDVSGRALKVELSGKSGPIPCPRLSGAPATKDGGTTGLRATMSISFDAVTDAKLGVTPTGACAPKLP